MTRNTKISLMLVAVVAVAVGTLVFANRSSNPTSDADRSTSGAADTSAEMLVRPDSHRLSTASDGKVTVVEFLDLECEACRAAFPSVEKLRIDYAGRVTFVMRFFPTPSHSNGELAARAVEAAGQQGQLESMYRTMFESQRQWADQRTPQREVFRKFAQQLGLDLAKFEAALDDQAVIDRVAKDSNDGASLGVKGTPTFFINGVQFPGGTYEDFKAAIDRELAK